MDGDQLVELVDRREYDKLQAEVRALELALHDAHNRLEQQLQDVVKRMEDVPVGDFCNEAETQRCDWKEDIDGNWGTSCKQCMCFEYAPPAEQGYKFCHHCGATINYIQYAEEELA